MNILVKQKSQEITLEENIRSGGRGALDTPATICKKELGKKTMRNPNRHEKYFSAKKHSHRENCKIVLYCSLILKIILIVKRFFFKINLQKFFPRLK